MTRWIALVAAAVAFCVSATANSGGYRYGVSDQAFYATAVVKDLHPSFFPRDTPLLETQSRLQLSDEILAALAKVTGADLPPLFFAVYVLTLVVLFAGSVAFAREMGLSWLATSAFLVLLTFRHRIAKTGANTLEGYMHPRQLAFGLGVAAFAAFLRGRRVWMVAFLGLAACWHPTTAFWFALVLGIATMAERQAWPWVAGTMSALALAAVLTVSVGPLSGRLIIMDAEWLKVLAEKDYLFPHEWPLYAWLINGGYAVVIVLICRQRQRLAATMRREGALVAGWLGLVPVFLFSFPFTMARLALPVQAQVTRVFWLLDFAMAAYLAWWLLDRVALSKPRLRGAILGLLAAASVGRGVFLVARPDSGRQLVQIGLPDTPWNEAMHWLKAQPSSWYVLADPGHAWKYGVSVRLAGEKDTLVEAGKDTALAMYDRPLALAVGERMGALSDFDRLTTDAARDLRGRYGLDVVIVERTHPLDLPVLHENGQFVVYDLSMSTPAQQFLSTYRHFVPRRWLGNGHAMTVFAWARKRAFPQLPSPEARLVQVSDDTQVLAHCYWQSDRASRGTLLALHGLEGSSDAHYMRGLAAKAWDRGWNAVLLNQRNCGGTEHLTPGLYHSGLTADPRAVIQHLARTDGVRAVGLVGYSLGGNLAVRMMGELGDSADLPIVGAVAISPTIDLETCVRAIERRSNFAYHFNFVRNLKGRMRRKGQSWPGAFDLNRLGSIWTIRTFDEIYTAPSHGYAGASDYYHRASAMRLVDRIRIPTLILTADNDPFVPAKQFTDPGLRHNPHVAVCVEHHGGHCGFATEPAGEDDGYWAETTAIEFLAPLMPR